MLQSGSYCHLNPVVDLFFELIFVDETVNLQGPEKMTDAFANAARQEFLGGKQRVARKGPSWRRLARSTECRPWTQGCNPCGRPFPSDAEVVCVADADPTGAVLLGIGFRHAEIQEHFGGEIAQ